MIKSKRIYVVNILLDILPNNAIQAFKSHLLRWAGVKVGNNVKIFQGVKIQGVGDVEIEDYVFIGHETLLMINEGSKIILKQRSGISSRVIIIAGYHHITPNGVQILSSEGTASTITIGERCSVSAGSMILPGVTIGEMSLVAAGSVVNRDVAPYTMVAGVPAVTKKVFEHD